MAIWGTPVSLLQFFGYSIALGGLMYYKLGAETLKAKVFDGQRAWAEYGNNHPAMRKSIVFGVMILTLFVLLGGVGPRYGVNKDYVTSLVGGGKAGQ